ncbi:hypothetical protein [Qipengyuania sp. ASV99]|uniref:hypothetical protein n=1 Tax=Qipengyuania sp. ASV99 TaxID=3399681 RepID=UPI003A4C65E8
MTGGRFTRRGWQAQEKLDSAGEEQAPREGAPLGGNRAEAAQRLQVGLFGIGAMVLLIGLANVLGNQADLTEERAVPDAAPTTEPTAAPAQRDPLADAGIVPEIRTEQGTTPADASAGPRIEDSEPTANGTPQN